MSANVQRVVRVPGFNTEGDILPPTVACDDCKNVPFIDGIFNLTMVTRRDGEQRFLCPSDLTKELASWAYLRPS